MKKGRLIGSFNKDFGFIIFLLILCHIPVNVVMKSDGKFITLGESQARGLGFQRQVHSFTYQSYIGFTQETAVA